MAPLAYEELVNTYSMLLPIPKLPEVTRSTEDLHCMSFEEAVLQPFSAEHIPSLQNRRKVNNLFIGVIESQDHHHQTQTRSHIKSVSAEWLSVRIA